MKPEAPRVPEAPYVLGWAEELCRECGYVTSGRTRRAVLEAMIDHQTWKMVRDMHRAVFPELPELAEEKRAH